VLILEALAKGSWRTYRLPQAAHCLQLWLECEPDNREALYLRGQVEERMHQYNEAIADFARVLELDAGHDQARLRLADALVHCHRPAEAVEHYENLLGRQPDSAPARLGLARARYSVGQPEEARKLLDALLTEHPRDATVLRERGKLALQTGHADEAEQWLRRALDVEPSERDLLYDLYLCLQQQGKRADAKKTLAELERLDNALQRLEGLTMQVAKTPRDPGPRYEVGVLFLENGQEKEGLRWLDSALQESPRHRPTCLALADYYARKGDAGQADHFRRRAEPAPAGGAASLLAPRP
jgi:predicted Zn-dependent protease